jgi:hypothetical protein
VKTHLDKNLLDDGAESRAWLVGLTYTSLILLLCLAGYKLIRQSSGDPATAVAPYVLRPQSQPVVPPAAPLPQASAVVSSPFELPPEGESSGALPAPAGSVPASVTEPAPEPALKPAPVARPAVAAAAPSVAEEPSPFAPAGLVRDDSFYDNSLIRIYRSKHPDDPMSNREMTESMGDHYKSRGTFLAYAEKFPDWVRLYNLIKKEDAGK